MDRLEKIENAKILSKRWNFSSEGTVKMGKKRERCSRQKSERLTHSFYLSSGK